MRSRNRCIGVNGMIYYLTRGIECILNRMKFESEKSVFSRRCSRVDIISHLSTVLFVSGPNLCYVEVDPCELAYPVYIAVPRSTILF